MPLARSPLCSPLHHASDGPSRDRQRLPSRKPGARRLVGTHSRRARSPPERCVECDARTSWHGGAPSRTDAFGRDVFARLVHGLRTVLAVGLGATAILFVMGVTLGATAGVAGGVVDAPAIAQAVGTLTSHPVAGARARGRVARDASDIGRGLFWTLALTRWTAVARVVRAETISSSGMGYVVAARALGASPARGNSSCTCFQRDWSALPAAVLGVASFVPSRPRSTSCSGCERPGKRGPPGRKWWPKLGIIRGRGALVGLPAMGLCTILVAFHLVGEAVRCALDPTLGAGCGRSGDTRVLSTSELTRSRGSRHMAL